MSTDRYYELTGCAPLNFGDVLMAEAVVHHLRLRLPRWKPCVRDARVRAAFVQPDEIALIRNPDDPFAMRLSRMLGLRSQRAAAHVESAQIGAIIDVCGYKYGGLWGNEALHLDLARYMDAAARGVRVILMPKTFGPFEAGSSDQVCRLVRCVSACLARDSISVTYLAGAGLRPGVDFELFTDFTTDVQAIPTPHPLPRFDWIMIPNINMVKSGRFGSIAAYLEHLELVVEAGASFGATALLAHHQGKDRKICHALAKRIKAPVLEPGKARVAKHVIGSARFVYSDRLHGIASSLSRSVPALTCGWSFKYAELMQDWNVPALLLDAPPLATGYLRDKIERVAGQYDQIVRALSSAKAGMQQRSERMWNRVESILV